MFGPAPASQTVPSQPDTVSRAPGRSAAPRRRYPRPAPRRRLQFPRQRRPTPTPAAGQSTPVVIETDLIRASIDPLGAVVSRVELLDQPVAPDWTASGLIGLVTGKRHDPNATTVLLEVGPNRVYVAQSGIVGGDFPNHRTPFKVIGPTQLPEGRSGSR